jgi:DNA-directed RNA polymerase specialized sigma24 family protein
MDTRAPELPDYAYTSIEVAARSLIGKGGFTPDDFEDIRSEITIHTLRQLPRFEADKASLRTFVNLVVRDGRAGLLRRRFTKKRWCRMGTASLDGDTGRDEDGVSVPLMDVLGADEMAISMGYRRRSRHEEAMLRLDVSTVLSQLPDDLRACCAAIMDGRTPTDVARESGIPQSTFRQRVLVPIRRAFEEAGIDARI